VAEVANVLEQTPVGGNVSAPASGTYGEGAALERLKTALPGSDPTQAPQQSPVPPMPGGGGPMAPAGMPRGLMAPTRRPDVPVSAPLSQPQVIVGSSPQGRQQLLQALVDDPEVSEETKEFAMLLLNHYKRVR
jgi:hypothetical protein